MAAWWPLVTGTLTALFAGIGVTLIIMDRLSRITTQFSDGITVHRLPAKETWEQGEINPDAWDSIDLSVLITNNSRQKIKVLRWEVSKIPVSGTFEGEIGKSIPIDGKADYSASFTPDWPSWNQSLSSGSLKPSFRASVIIDRNTSIYRTISRTAIITVNPEIIRQNAAKPSQNS